MKENTCIRTHTQEEMDLVCEIAKLYNIDKFVCHISMSNCVARGRITFKGLSLILQAIHKEWFTLQHFDFLCELIWKLTMQGINVEMAKESIRKVINERKGEFQNI